MPHLLSFRSGWENERLASYLLSRFSFVAQPNAVSEDLGSDFFCTLFEIVPLESGHDALRPLSSFAIQIKSSADEIEMDNKIDYLWNLELPFFIGVVSQSPPAVDIYSAEFLPLLFASKLAPRVADLHKICTRAHSNIAARFNEEHIYDVDGKGLFQMVAGPGSAQHFRMNFVKRLGEVFKNLDWLLDNGQEDDRWRAEFRCFDSFYRAFTDLHGGIVPAYVAAPYLALKQKLERRRPVT